MVTASGRFEAVGSNIEILNLAGETGVEVYDLKKTFVMPGIHDAHTHLLLASMQKKSEIDIGFDSTASTIGEIIKGGHECACACAEAHFRGDWLVANFYAGDNFPDGRIDRKYLDTAFPDQPLIVRDISCHHVALNSAGLERIGCDIHAQEDPPGGRYVRRPDGSLTGELIEYATAQVWRNLPQPPVSYVKDAILYGIQMSQRYGITSVQEASANTIYLTALRELEQENRLNMDIFPHIVHAPETFAAESQESLHHLIDAADAFRSKHVDTRFVKFWLDGAPTPPHFTHCSLRTDGPDESRLLIDFDAFIGALTKYDAKGMSCKVHCAGDGSVRRALDTLETVRRSNPTGPRHELAHCNTVHKGRSAPQVENIVSDHGILQLKPFASPVQTILHAWQSSESLQKCHLQYSTRPASRLTSHISLYGHLRNCRTLGFMLRLALTGLCLRHRISSLRCQRSWKDLVRRLVKRQKKWAGRRFAG